MTVPNSESQGLKNLKLGLQPGLLVMLAWKEEKLIRPYEAMKKLERRPETILRSPMRIQMTDTQKTKM